MTASQSIEHFVLTDDAAQLHDDEHLAVRSVRRDELGRLEIGGAIGSKHLRLGHREEVLGLTNPFADYGALQNHRGAVLGPVFPDHIGEFCNGVAVAVA